MEAFSLLKYWRNGGGAVSTGATTTTSFTPDSAAKAATKTIVAAAAAVSPYSSDGEDGPFFDLEFGVPDQESDTDEQTSEESLENDVKRLQSEDGDETESEEEASEEEEAELKFSLSSNGCMDQNAALSPSDDLFFKGDLVTIEPSGILLNAAADDSSRFPVSLLKSATKFRVLLLKLKKSKSVNGEAAEISGKDEAGGRSPEIVERESQGKMSGKLFVKFKVDEAPLANLLSRENSSKENHGKKAADSDATPPSEERRKVSNEAMSKYLKMVKPFYVRVSKRYVEKLKFSGGGPKGCAAAPTPEAAAANAKNHSHPKQSNNLQAGLKVVRKHLGKSRSASAAAAAAAPPAKAVSDRRDDSLLQLQDGIQGAILHCKKSFNASRGTHLFK